ncbi:hypothetical protein C9I94_07050 [Photobacterium swingsii]|uniref:Uncharacterized protein n=1 Tax=Photobacterium swingsii TaxID=680026 RepID=A0A2T3P998_9GAMM|nr:hypothetical protein C9I94_07050 [Photobacterium swingsii]
MYHVASIGQNSIYFIKCHLGSFFKYLNCVSSKYFDLVYFGNGTQGTLLHVGYFRLLPAIGDHTLCIHAKWQSQNLGSLQEGERKVLDSFLYTALDYDDSYDYCAVEHTVDNRVHRW